MKPLWPILTSFLLLVSCSSAPVSLSPSQQPSPFTAHQVLTPDSGAVFQDGLAIGGGHLTIRAVKASTGERIVGAQVSLLGPTPAFATNPATLDLTFEPLMAGTYSVRVAATGYATQLHTGVVIDPANPQVLTYTLQPSGGDVTGTVLDMSNHPIVGAWVSLGATDAFTDANGHFDLSGVQTGVQSVSIGKTGFQGLTAPVNVGSSAMDMGNLTLAAGTRVISLDNPIQAFAGRTVGVALADLRTALEGDGFTFQTNAATADIRLIASPTRTWLGEGTAEAASLQSFVAGGGKLILMGEWGGCNDYTPDAMNQLASRFGLALNPDLVEMPGGTPPEWLHVTEISSVLPAVTPIPNGIQLFDSCSIFAPPPAVAIAGVGNSGYRIASILNGDFTVAAVRPFGKGLVIALGDTSAWITPGTRNNHPNNLVEASNQAFILDLFRW